MKAVITFISVKNAVATIIIAPPEGIDIKVYCATCNAFICRTTYDKHKEIYKNIDEDTLNDDVALRRIFRRSGITQEHCGKCNCLLYSSWQPKIVGQFDLRHAKFCPKL